MNFLGWIDHDSTREEAILRALGAAKGSDARDELGLGTIRDSFADLFFPGTSTIQQRVRYFLFVQWCCELAATQGDAAKIVSRLRNNEEALIASLTHLGEGEGVIGIVSQENLERMPSEIYWNGLLVLGMRKTRGNRNRWARQMAANRAAAKESGPSEEGRHPTADWGFATDRPSPPPGFPTVKNLRFELDRDEAEYLRTRLSAGCVNPDGIGHQDNLFGPFSRHRRRTNVAALWEHPRMMHLKPAVLEMVMLASAFARIMQGASILYNVCVARLLTTDKTVHPLVEEHANDFKHWSRSVNTADTDLLIQRLPEVQGLGAITRHRVDDRTVSFVRRWAELSRLGTKLLRHEEAISLVSNREIYLKAGAGTSRIKFAKQRETWKGHSGSQIMDYRWHTVRRCLNDLGAAPRA